MCLTTSLFLYIFFIESSILINVHLINSYYLFSITCFLVYVMKPQLLPSYFLNQSYCYIGNTMIKNKTFSENKNKTNNVFNVNYYQKTYLTHNSDSFRINSEHYCTYILKSVHSALFIVLIRLL